MLFLPFLEMEANKVLSIPGKKCPATEKGVPILPSMTITYW
jgi:hypothetical protein